MIKRGSLFNHLVVLNVIGVAFYFWIFSLLGGVSDETMRYGTDATYYFHYGDWLFGQAEATGHLATRPFLFPLFIKLCTSIGGINFLWFCQFLFWILSVNFVFFALKIASKSTFAAWIGGAIVLTNVSYIALTLHGLSEVATIFLLSIFIYLVARNMNNLLGVKFVRNLVLLLVMLALIRPVFYPLLLLFLFTFVPLAIYKTKGRNRFGFLRIGVYLIPMLLQIGFMKVNYDTFSISKIGPETVKNYFFAKGHAHINSMEHSEALSEVINYSQEEVWAAIMKNKKVYLEQFKENIFTNITASPDLLNVPNKNPGLYDYQYSVNYYYFRIHVVAGFLLFIISLILLIRRKWNTLLQLIIVITPILVILLASGLSFWQGDRLTVPSIPLWATLYTCVCFESIRWSGNQKQRALKK